MQKRTACLAVIALVGAGWMPCAAAEGPVLNEFCAVNDSTLRDQDGDASDWIEIHNGWTSAVSLAGWCLTDTESDPDKWIFPERTLAAGRYLVVFASGKDRRSPAGELHTNFKLDGDGEYLALVAPDRATVWQAYAPRYPEQRANVSYGVSTNATGALRYFATPTPGAANGGDFLGTVADTKFSADRGFYTNPVAVAITTATPGATIRYTLDGTIPSEVQGQVYSGPIAISSTRTLRAIAYKTGYRATDVDTHTYIFLKDVIAQPTMNRSITGDPVYGPLMNDALTAIPSVSVVTPYGINASSEVKTSIELIFPDGTEGFQIDTGIKVVGGASVGFPKNSLRLYFRDTYGYSKLNYPLFTGHPYGEPAVEEFDQLTLRADHDSVFYLDGRVPGGAQYLRNRWMSDMQFRMGQISLHGRFVHVYLNGVYWGQYHLIERANDDFLAQYLGADQDDYEAINAGYQMGSTPPLMWNTIVSSLANYELEKRCVDLENLADYMLLNHYAGNTWDWGPNHNWGAGGPTRPDWGGYKFFAWDSDIIFQGVNENNLGVGAPQGVYHGLRQHADFRMLFADRIYKHFFNEGALTPAITRETYDFRASQIYTSLVAETARWQPYPLWTRDNQWLGELNRLREGWFPVRTDIVVQQFRAAGWYALNPPTFSQRGGLFGPGFTLAIQSTNVVYYTLDGSDPRAAGTGAAAGLLYSGPIPLVRTVQVKARARTSDTEWSALQEAVFVRAEPSPLRITEVMYHPRGPRGAAEVNHGWSADDFEFIELCNTGSSAVGLPGTRFTDGVRFDFTTSPLRQLEPGARAVVVRNRAAFAARYGAGPAIAGEYQKLHNFPQPALANDGETLTLTDPLGSNLCSFTYGSGRGWPAAADGAGHSLVPRVVGDPPSGALDYGGNWRASACIDGTPGGPDPEPRTDVVLNEICAHTDYTNAARPEYDSNDWIELFNTASGAVSLAGWYLSDDRESLDKWPIPPATVIGAQGWLSFDEVTGFHTPITNGFGLNKTGEALYLSYLPGTAEDRVADCVQFKGQEAGWTLGRYPDGGPYWSALAPTRTAANAAPTQPVVISEVMYHPRPTEEHPEDNTQDEYIEILNAGTAAAPLWTEAGPWRLDGGVDYGFPPSITLPAGGRLVLVPFDPADPAALSGFLRAYGLSSNEVPILGPYDGKLSNRGERIALERPLEPDSPVEPTPWVIVDEVIYFDQPPWPELTDGTGRPLQRNRDPGPGSDPASWKAGYFASPGLPPPKVAITTPDYGATILQPQTATAVASVDGDYAVGSVQQVEFYLDGQRLLVDTNAPYQCGLSAMTEEGVHTLSCAFRDDSGTCTSRPAALVVSTVSNEGGVSNATATSARPRGRLSHDGRADVTVFWGPTDGRTERGAWSNRVDLGAQRGDFSAAVTGLKAGATYYYRCYATNAYGEDWADQTASWTGALTDVSLSLAGTPIAERGGAATVTARLASASAFPVTVNLAFAGTAAYAADYTASAAHVVIPAGGLAGAITLAARDDAEIEAPETLVVRIASVLNAAAVEPDSVTATLLSDDPQVTNRAAIAVTDRSATLGGNLTHGGSAGGFVHWGRADGGANAAGWERVTALGAVTEGPFVAPVSGLLANQTYYYRCRATNAAGTAWADASGQFTTAPPTLSIADTEVREGNSGTAEAAFTVALSAASGTDVSVGYSSSDGTARAGLDYRAAGGRLVIPAGRPAGSITLEVLGDAENEWPSETFSVTLAGPTNAFIARGTATGTIQDDDVAVYLVRWPHRMPITLRGYRGAETLADFPALVRLGTNLAHFSYAQFASRTGADLRFANEDLTALLNYEIESWNTNGQSSVWVQVPRLRSTNTVIWAYWGNPAGAAPPPCWTNGATWSAGYAGVWHLNDPVTAGTYPDSAPRRCHGIDTGTARAPGRIADGRDFEGADSISLPAAAFATISNATTISVWIYGDEALQPQSDYLFEGRTSAGGREFCGHVPWGDGVVYWDAFGNADRISKLAAAADYKSRWNHWAFTKDSATGIMQIYINGALWHSGSGMTRPYTPLSLFKIGSDAYGGGNYDGAVDEFRVSTVVRSADWIGASWLSQASNDLFCAIGPVASADPNRPSVFLVYGATNVTDRAACLTARLTSTGTAETAVWFYWGAGDGGRDPEGWSNRRAMGAAAGAPDIDYTAYVSGLASNTLYYYACRAANLHGDTWAAGSFTTLGPPLLESAGGATNIDVGVATLRGRVANEGRAEVTLYWGPSDGGTDPAAWAGAVPVGTVKGGAAFAAPVDGLLHGVGYLYRIYATNRYGASWLDPPVRFTTPPPRANVLTVTAGLALWLDAADADGDGLDGNNPPEGATVFRWRDKSGRGNDADIVDGLSRPAYTRAGPNAQPALAFDGDDFLYTTHNFDDLRRYTILSVARYTGGDSERVISSRTHNWLFGFWGNGDERWYAEGWVWQAGTGNTEWHLHAGTITDDADPRASFWKEGHRLASDLTGSHDSIYQPGQLGLGAFQNQNSEASKCQVAEVLIYDRVLNEAELDAAGSYLANKYALPTAYSGDSGGIDTGIENGPASRIDIGTAELSATLMASGSVFDVRAHWGKADAGATGAWEHTARVGSWTNVTATNLRYRVSGLAGETAYYYTFSASNAAGVLFAGPSGTFETLPNIASWGRRMKISFPGYARGQSLTNFPALVLLGTNVPGFAYSQFAFPASGRDLRFTDPDGAALAYEIETWATNGSSVVWVRVPELEPTGLDHIWAHWDNEAAPAAAYATNGAVWADGFRGVWHMAEPDVPDAAARGHNGTRQGAVASRLGAIGRASEFDPGEYVSVPKSADFVLSDDYTISAWIYAHDGGERGFMGSWQNGFIFAVRAGSLRFLASQNGGGWDAAGGAIALNRWHYATVTRRGSVATLYLDGADKLTFTGYPVTGCDDDLEFGAGGADWRGWFDGGVDEGRIEAVARSADWIRACWLSQASNRWFNACSDLEIVNREAPWIQTRDGVTGITSTSAWLRASLTSTGAAPAEVWAYWGPSDAGTNFAWSGTNAFGVCRAPLLPAAYSHQATGLQPGTVYFYRYRAANSRGAKWSSPSVGFKTLGPPRVTHGPGATPAADAAILHGELTAGTTADAFVCWGTADAGTNRAWQNVVALGEQPEGGFAHGISNLLYGIRYYYRCYVTNDFGRDWSDASESFFTLPRKAQTGVPVTNGLAVWLDAGTRVATNAGGRVQRWDDLSRGAHHATLTAGAPILAPAQINVRPAVQFRRSDGEDYLALAGTLFAREQYIVWRSPYARFDNYGGILGNPGTRSSSYIVENQQTWFHGNQLPLAVSRNGTVLSGSFDLSPVTDWMVTKITVNHNDTSPKPHWLGRQDGYSFSMDVAELIGYEAALTPAQEQLVGGYLASKYGIATAYPPYAPPLGIGVTNRWVTNLTATTAVLEATLLGGGAVFDAAVYWGTADGGPQTGAWAHAHALGSFTNIAAGRLSFEATGLATNTPHYFTFRAWNAATNLWATPSVRFDTMAPPTVENAAAGGVTTNAATLNGLLSRGGLADITVYWGLADGGTNAAAWGNTNRLGTRRPGTFATAAAPRSGGTYYFRCRAANALGGDWADQSATFMTPRTPVSLSLAGASFSENAGAMVVTATLGMPAASNVTVRFAFGGGARLNVDYTPSATSVVIAAGQRSASILLTGRDDAELESAETVSVSIASADHAIAGSPSSVTATLISEDVQVLTSAASAVTENSARLNGTLAYGDAATVTVYWGFADGGTDPASWRGTNSLGSRAEGAFSVEVSGLLANQAVFYRCYAANAGGGDWAEATRSFTTLAPRLTVASLTVVEGDTAGVLAAFPASLSTPSAVPVSVQFATADGSALAGADYVSTNGTLALAAGQSGGTITVQVRPDELNEWPFEAFDLTLANAAGCVLASPRASCRITDDDLDLSGWRYRMPIRISGYDPPGADETLTNFPALVVLGTNRAGFAYSQFASPVGADLMFLDMAGAAVLNYEVESWRTNGDSLVWVQVPALAGTNTAVWAYWGNPGVRNPPPCTTNGAVWSQGYLAVWHLGAAAGTTARDSTTNGYAGTLRNMDSADWVPGIAGNGLDFDGNNDYVTATLNEPETEITHSLWFKTAADNRGLFSIVQDDLGNGGHDRHIHLSGGNIRVRVWNDESKVTAGLSLADNRWHQVVHVIGASVGGQKVYVDGVERVSGAKAYSDFNWQQRLHFGWSADANPTFALGRIDEVRVSKAARSAAWVWASWRNLAAPEQFAAYNVVVDLAAADQDGDGLPDAWERRHFATTSATGGAGDWDRDGMTDRAEYTAGTDPTNRASRFALWLNCTNGTVVIHLPTVATTPDDAGETRYYSIERATSLVHRQWLGIPDFTNIAGWNQTVIYSNAAPAPPPAYFRGRVWVEGN